MTLIWFDTLDSVSAFTGEDHEALHLPPQAHAVLADFDRRPADYEYSTAVNSRCNSPLHRSFVPAPLETTMRRTALASRRVCVRGQATSALSADVLSR